MDSDSVDSGETDVVSFTELERIYNEYQETVNEYQWLSYRRIIAVYLCLYTIYSWSIYRLRYGLVGRLHGLDLMALCIGIHFYEIYYRRSIGAV
jgi:hypothetical protein